MTEEFSNLEKTVLLCYSNFTEGRYRWPSLFHIKTISGASLRYRQTEGLALLSGSMTRWRFPNYEENTRPLLPDLWRTKSK